MCIRSCVRVARSSAYPVFLTRHPYPPAEPEGLRCICSCAGVAGSFAYPVLPRAPLKRPRQDRRNLRASAALWEWRGPVHIRFSDEASLSPKRWRQDHRDRGIRRYVGVDGPCAFLVLPCGVPIPQVA